MSNQEKDTKAIEKKKPTVAERFVSKVEREFEGAVGHGIEFTDEERQLASNLFIKIDSALKQHEADRNENQAPYKWENVDMQKLATDAVHRVRLGLDASIKNHIHVIPYFNGKTKKYDLNLQVGYKGKAYYRKRMAVDNVRDIRYELVHESDVFKVIKKSGRESIEDFAFDVKDPFDRGDIVGGFGYIVYEDETKNKVVLVSEEEFVKVKNTAQTKLIWNQWPDKMRLKTLVHRVTDELDMDPQKINPSYNYVEDQDDPFKDPNNEVKIEQPAEREPIDIDLGGEGLDVPEEPNASTNGNTTDAQPADEEKAALKAEVNKLGKDVHGKDWFQESKVMASNYSEEAETIVDLDTDGLTHLKRQLEAETQGA